MANVVGRTQRRDPAYRFHSGFDRWDPAAIRGREFLCRVSHVSFIATDESGGLWWWDADLAIWWKMDEANAIIFRGDNAGAVAHLRRALPIIRLFENTTFPGERQAARAALARIGEAISATWRSGPGDYVCSVSSAHSVYVAAVKDCRWQLLGDRPPPYREKVAAAMMGVSVGHYRLLGSGDIDRVLADMEEHPN